MAENLDSGIRPARAAMQPRAPRIAVDAEVLLWRSGQNNYRVRVYDASPNGCRIQFVERPSLDERLWVRFGQLEGIEGQVCWVDGFVGGIQFVRPIHPAVFDRLVTTLG